jgi:hypothetical protein
MSSISRLLWTWSFFGSTVGSDPGPAAIATTGPCRRQTGFGPLLDEPALELGQGGEDVEKPTHDTGTPSVAKRRPQHRHSRRRVLESRTRGCGAARRSSRSRPEPGSTARRLRRSTCRRTASSIAVAGVTVLVRNCGSCIRVSPRRCLPLHSRSGGCPTATSRQTAIGGPRRQDTTGWILAAAFRQAGAADLARCAPWASSIAAPRKSHDLGPLVPPYPCPDAARHRSRHCPPGPPVGVSTTATGATQRTGSHDDRLMCGPSPSGTSSMPRKRRWSPKSGRSCSGSDYPESRTRAGTSCRPVASHRCGTEAPGAARPQTDAGDPDRAWKRQRRGGCNDFLVPDSCDESAG